jgi:hypothetical protein
VGAAVLDGKQRRHALTQKIYRVRSQGRAGEYRGDAVVNDGRHSCSSPETGPCNCGSKEGEKCRTADVDCRGDGARRQADAPGPGLSFSFVRGATTIPFAGHERGILEYSRGVADELRVSVDEPGCASIAVGVETAELVHHVVGIEADGFGIIANERARKDAGRPLGKVVAFEASPEVSANLGDRNNGVDTDTASLSFAAQSGAESVSIRHDVSNPTANFTPIGFCRIAEVLASCSTRDPQFCNHFARF